MAGLTRRAFLATTAAVAGSFALPNDLLARAAASLDHADLRSGGSNIFQRLLDLGVVVPQEHDELRVDSTGRQFLDERDDVMFGATDGISAGTAGQEQDVGDGDHASSGLDFEFDETARAVSP